MKEATTVMDQIKKLLESKPNKKGVKCSDIGVVTPYKLQCKIINKLCQKLGYSDITIGTAEVFQGQEKPIMILSTVRTGGELGFVNRERVIFIDLHIFTCLLNKNRFFIVFDIILENQRCINAGSKSFNRYW